MHRITGNAGRSLVDRPTEWAGTAGPLAEPGPKGIFTAKWWWSSKGSAVWLATGMMSPSWKSGMRLGESGEQRGDAVDASAPIGAERLAVVGVPFELGWAASAGDDRVRAVP